MDLAGKLDENLQQLDRGVSMVLGVLASARWLEVQPMAGEAPWPEGCAHQPGGWQWSENRATHVAVAWCNALCSAGVS